MTREDDLQKWNNSQRELWLKLVDQELVGRRDCETFKVFAGIFCWYQEQYGFEPSLKDMVLLLGLGPE